MSILNSFSILFFILLYAHTGSAETQLQKPILDDKFECTHPPYKIHIFSTSPLVIYISNFIISSERAHLLSITESTFSPSLAASSQSHSGLHSTRTSSSTSLSPDDPVVACIQTRALQFQGLSIPVENLEPLQLVSYTQNQTYHFHTDWFTSPALAAPSLGGNRLSSFFVYVLAEDLTGGSTNFPILDAPRTEGSDGEGEEWCKYVDCDEEYEKGVSFRAVEGNAVFWENMIEVPDGKGGVERRGDERMLHAGLPVTSGRKVGMNIWTREGEIPAAVRGVVDKD